MLSAFGVRALTLFLVIYSACALSQDDFRLGAGDVVKITVYDQPDLSTNSKVNAAGVIVMPLVGAVKVGGLTATQAEQRIAQMLQEGGFVKNPQVVLAITEIRSQQVAVLGFVKNSAKIPFEGSMSIIDVIAQAGGLTNEAGDNVQILREEGTKRKVIRVDMGAVFNGSVDQVIDVRAGDVVLVPRMDVFYIYGAVNKAGSYRLERDMTVVQALSIGGGLSARGTQRGIRVKRRNVQGTIEDLKTDLNGILKPNDVIFVDESIL